MTFSGGVSSPVISDDGRVIAFLRSDGLWAVETTGSGERVLVSEGYLASVAGPASRARIKWFDFAPHSHVLYFDTILEPLEEGFPMPRFDLHRTDADVPAPAQILGEGQGGQAYFSPDGQWMALSLADHISIARPDGSALRTVFTFPMVSTYSEWFYLPEVVWMNTSGGFYVITPAPAILENPSEPARWWYVPLDGKAAQLAAFVTAPVWVSFPRLSPDGTRALYVRPRPGGGYELHLTDVSTADILLASYEGDVFGVGGWSPDGRYYTFYQGDTRNVLYASVGQPPQPLSDVGLADFVAWMDGNTVLFKHGAELRLRALDASSLLIDASVSDNQFDFVP